MLSRFKHFFRFVFSRSYRRSYRQSLKDLRTSVNFQLLQEKFPRVDSSYSDCLVHNCPYRTTENLVNLPSEDRYGK